jgi:hypothetical protein
LTWEGDGVSEVLVLSGLPLISGGYNHHIVCSIKYVPLIVWLNHQAAPAKLPLIVFFCWHAASFDIYPVPAADLRSHLYSYLSFVPLYLTHRDLIAILIAESPQIPLGSDPVQECHCQWHSLIFPEGLHQ